MKSAPARSRGVKRRRAGRIRSGIASLLVGLLAALLAATAARGNDHRVPRVNLHVNEQAKRLHPWSYSWVSADGRGRCVGEEGDGTPTFSPRADVSYRGNAMGLASGSRSCMRGPGTSPSST